MDENCTNEKQSADKILQYRIHNVLYIVVIIYKMNRSFGMSLAIQSMIYMALMAAIGLLLFVAGVVDIRKRQISRGQLLLLLFVCCAVIPVKKDFGIIDAVGGLTIGLCVVGVSIATREQIGKGDGFVIAAVGIALGMRKCLWVLFAASFVMCAVAIVVLIFRKGGRQTRLPFLPAMFAGYLLCFLW